MRGLRTVYLSHNSTQEIIPSVLNYYVSQGPEMDFFLGEMQARRSWTFKYFALLVFFSPFYWL